MRIRRIGCWDARLALLVRSVNVKSAGKHHRAPLGKIISLAIIAVGVAAGLYAEHISSIHPSSDDATIDADVVHVASPVGGKIIEILVTENAKVSKGDLLFRIDPEPYRLAVEQAEADLGVAIAARDTRRRAVATEKSTATIAGEQTKRAQANVLGLAFPLRRTVTLRVAVSFVPTIEL
ncbi:biotin/lipoyl-binding protein [Bradyrhizobium lablabi]|uniref:biotin/lipoyl-binding protein n=1 Tax=Bradyrhizobium lablabi TaxID=722472 RepID=UPI000B8463B5|nr:biotin/lipoyl-binding protein [Bradyrhizobium lablabi]